jgi:hypothetical protein
MRGSAILIPAVLVCASSPSFADNFGALAYDRASGAWGVSYNYPSQRAADSSALSRCAPACSVVVRFSNTCAAYATGNGTSEGWGYDAVRRNAERRALAECSARGGNCKIEIWACNSQPSESRISGGPEPRPRNSCWYRNGHRVPDCRD